jgi:hypothetical protein
LPIAFAGSPDHRINESPGRSIAESRNSITQSPDLQSPNSRSIITLQSSILPVTDDEKTELVRLLEAHERTLAMCRACAETTRDLAWEVKRGGTPPAAALTATLEQVQRVLHEVGQVEIAIAQMKAALW